MTLLSAIPGLSAHQVDIPEPVVSFDFIKADRLLAELNESVGSAYPDAGCVSWLVANQSPAFTALCAGENAVDLAYLAGDMPALEKAVDLLRRMYLKAFGLYAARPPVIEVQEAFL